MSTELPFLKELRPLGKGILYPRQTDSSRGATHLDIDCPLRSVVPLGE